MSEAMNIFQCLPRGSYYGTLTKNKMVRHAPFELLKTTPKRRRDMGHPWLTPLNFVCSVQKQTPPRRSRVFQRPSTFFSETGVRLLFFRRQGSAGVCDHMITPFQKQLGCISISMKQSPLVGFEPVTTCPKGMHATQLDQRHRGTKLTGLEELLKLPVHELPEIWLHASLAQ